MARLFLSVVIPCFDEMANLQKGVLDKVVHFLGKEKFSYEIIIVDDGSKDGSDRFIQKAAKEYPQIKLIKNNHLGKAGAVTAGMLQAQGEYVLFTDMDQATPIEEIDKLLPYFQEAFDVVIGSRSNARKGAPLIRLFISRANIILRKLIVGVPSITDTQCGFKMFRHEAAQQIFSKVYDMHHGFQKISGSSVTSGFDVELLLIAAKMKYKIKEVPVTWLYVETRRVNPVKDSIEGVKELLLIRMNDMKGKYS
jgi:dolichyl-phosphate beta-glucosyltransferase